ncbi:uncharacterized protein LOC142104592 [Mixophyes fleayi]|uniref:uncharacterized protein LOC142104592 n=1 Tax=Mixophyes fleayi TaxID=3061075 RepID=UPI003F4DC82E
MVQITQERPSTASSNTGKYCSLLNRFPTLPFLLEKRESSAYPAERSLLPRVSHSAYYRNASNQMHMRARPQTAGPSTVSLRDRNNRCDLVCADKRLNDKGVRGQQHENTSLPPRFVTVGTLGYGGVFGLAELITKSTNLRYSLISEGAECIFIPTKLFLSEAPIKSKQIAQELVNTFPTETKIRESYATLQRWTAYKDRLIEKQLNGGMKYQHHRK